MPQTLARLWSALATSPRVTGDWGIITGRAWHHNRRRRCPALTFPCSFYSTAVYQIFPVAHQALGSNSAMSPGGNTLARSWANVCRRWPNCEPAYCCLVTFVFFWQPAGKLAGSPFGGSWYDARLQAWSWSDFFREALSLVFNYYGRLPVLNHAQPLYWPAHKTRKRRGSYRPQAMSQFIYDNYNIHESFVSDIRVICQWYICLHESFLNDIHQGALLNNTLDVSYVGPYPQYACRALVHDFLFKFRLFFVNTILRYYSPKHKYLPTRWTDNLDSDSKWFFSNSHQMNCIDFYEFVFIFT